MRKVILAAGSVAAAGTAALGLGLGVGAGSGHAAPGDTNTTLNVVGEPYAKAVAILRAQGVKASFGGSVGGDLPQAQCIVASQKVLASSHKMQLNLDCNAPEGASSPADTSSPGGTSGAAPTAAATDGARPTPGAPGVVTVVPKQVG